MRMKGAEGPAAEVGIRAHIFSYPCCGNKLRKIIVESTCLVAYH